VGRENLRQRRFYRNYVIPSEWVTGKEIKKAEEKEQQSPLPVLEKTIFELELVRIPGGEFIMGAAGGHMGEISPHRVTVGDFYLGKSEVTQAQWKEVMGNNPSNFADCGDCPVENVSWNDVQEFLHKASEMTGMKLRLPTEAEWEYAAGEGSVHKEWAGTQNMSSLGHFAWYKNNSEGRTHPVGQKEANRFGLYDMSGNVSEWCFDWYDSEYYRKSPSDNPQGPSQGKFRVIRGGSFSDAPPNLRVINRLANGSGVRFKDYGFRVAMDAP
jgi:formylglycine-generating enzyme required for sulfatase activity